MKSGRFNKINIVYDKYILKYHCEKTFITVMFRYVFLLSIYINYNLILSTFIESYSTLLEHKSYHIFLPRKLWKDTDLVTWDLYEPGGGLIRLNNNNNKKT